MMILLLNNDDFTPVLQRLHILSLSVSESKSVTNFAVEDGSTRSDHAYDEQTEIVLVCTYSGPDSQAIYSEMRHIYDAGQLLIVQTRNNTYKDMVLAGLPREEPGEIADGTVISLILKQWRDVKAREGSFTVSEVAVPQQSDTSTGGVKNGQASDRSIESVRGTDDPKTPKHIQDSLNRYTSGSAQRVFAPGILKGAQGK